MLDRELRQVRAKAMPNVKRETLQKEVLKQRALWFAFIHRLNAVTYRPLLDQRYVHEVVSHADEYVRDPRSHERLREFLESVEGTLRGRYVAVEPFHLDRYLAEQAFRFNNRATKDNPLDDSDRFVAALAQTRRKRLDLQGTDRKDRRTRRRQRQSLSNPFRKKRGRKPKS